MDGLKSRFAYYLDCQLATVEYLAGLKSRSANEFKRHIEIAEKMLLDARIYEVDLTGTRGDVVVKMYMGSVIGWLEGLEGKSFAHCRTK